MLQSECEAWYNTFTSRPNDDTASDDSTSSKLAATWLSTALATSSGTLPSRSVESSAIDLVKATNACVQSGTGELTTSKMMQNEKTHQALVPDIVVYINQQMCQYFVALNAPRQQVQRQRFGLVG